MEALILIVALVIFLLVLVKSAQLVEGSFEFLSKKLKISEFFTGFVILSIITSLPEMSISVLSSQEVPELSVGNLIGATTVLLTLVIGLSAVKYGKLEFKSRFKEKEVLMGIGLIGFMVICILDRYISIPEGIALLSLYFSYIGYLNHKFNQKSLKKSANIEIRKLSKLLGKAGLGIILLLISSSVIVKLAESLAITLSISPAIIGILILAVGTNLPEITILLISKKTKDDEDLALGNFFGSACVNPGILGLLAIMAGGVKIDSFVVIISYNVILVLTLILFAIATWTGKKVTKTEGYMLAALYIALLISEFAIIIGL